MELDYTDLTSLNEKTSRLLEFAGDIRIWLFDGEMGTGKTTLIKSVCHNLGIEDFQMSSPTFGIANEYESDQAKVYHFDLYRINHIGELFDIGFTEYLDSGNYCFVEWPELAKSFLPNEYLEITLKKADISRRLFVRKHV